MRPQQGLGDRRFGVINRIGLFTLARREVMRFMSIWMQTIAGPLVSTGLMLAVFAVAIGPQRGEVMGLPYLVFLTPGLMMMSVIQNAFANTSSSLMVAKVQGSIVDTLMPPLSPLEMVLGYTAGGVARGLVVALALGGAVAVMFGSWPVHPLWALTFAVLGGAMMGGLGLIAAVYAQKFDQMAVITNFVITPLSFLSGSFYSLEALPPILAKLSHLNPVFYLIDGMRFGMIGRSDSAPELGLAVCTVTTVGVLGLCWHWFRIGYRIKS